MTDRGIFVIAGAIVLAGVIGGLLLVGAVSAQPERRGEFRARVFFGDRPPPAARTIEQVQERVPAAVRPLVPVQRELAGAFREAASYLLVLIGVAAALVFARGQVAATYRASLGGWRTQTRVLLLGGAVLAVIVSSLFLVFVVMLGTVAGVDRAGGGPGPIPVPGPGAGIALGPLLQVGVTAASVALVLVALVALIGLAAAAWRIGDAIVSSRPLARISQGAPATLVALLGVSVVYVLTQLPVIGPLVLLGTVAYALGLVAAARLAPAAATPGP